MPLALEIEHKNIESLSDCDGRNVSALIQWTEVNLDAASPREFAERFNRFWKGWFLYLGGNHCSIHTRNGAERLLMIYNSKAKGA